MGFRSNKDMVYYADVSLFSYICNIVSFCYYIIKNDNNLILMYYNILVGDAIIYNTILLCYTCV